MIHSSLKKNILGGDEGLKKGKTSTLIFWACLWTIALFCSAFFVTKNAQSAAPPNIITYQGKLLQSGASVTTTQNMGFLIYSQVTGGALLYSSTGTLPASTGTIPIAVNQGVFNVNFGDTGTNGLPTTLFKDNSNLFLEVWINNSGTLVKLSPRKQITASPFAINSQFLLGYSPAVTSSSAYIPVSDSNGNFSFEGTTQSASVSGGILYINPATTDPDETLFGVAVGGSERFRLDENGNAWLLGNMSVTGTLDVLSTGTFSELVSTGITLGGVRRTTWPSSGGGSGFWASSTGRIYPTTLTDVVLIGKNTTSSASSIFEVSGASFLDGDVTLGSGRALNLSGIFTQTGTSTLATTTVAKLTVTGITSGINLQHITGSSTLSYLAGDNTFTGINVFSATSTFSTSTFNGNTIVNGFLNVTGNTLKPKALGSYTNNTLLDGVDKVVVINDIAYIGTTTGTLALVDVSNPNSPTLLGSYTSTTLETTDEINLQVAGNYAYFGNSNQTHIIDISRPGSPVFSGYVLDEFDSNVGASAFVLSGNYLFTSNFVGNGMPEHMDITNPLGAKKFTVNGNSDLGQGRDIAVFGHYAYVLASNSLLGIFDIRNPKIVTEVGSVTNNNFSDTGFGNEKGGIFVQGRYAYITALQSGDGTAGDALTIVDVKNPASPLVIGTLASTTNPLLDDPSSVFVSGDYAYVTSHAQDALVIINISDPTAPSVAASITDSASSVLAGAKAVAVSGNYAYVVSQTDRSLQVIDVSGAKISNAEIGSARISDIQVSGQSYFGSNLNIQGGLTVGNSGLLLRGDLSISGTVSTSTGQHTTGTVHFAGPALFDSQTLSGESAFIFRPKSSFTGNILSVRSGNNDSFLEVGSTGNFGIATSTPGFPLSVVGTGYISGNFFVGSANEQISTSTFTLNGDDVYIHDLLGVGDSIFVEQALYIGTSSLQLTGDSAGGQISAGAGPLTIDSTGVLSFNTLHNQAMNFGGNSTFNGSVNLLGKPTEPVQTSVLLDADSLSYGVSGTQQFLVDGDYAYVTAYGESKFSILDIRDKNNPKQLSVLADTGSLTLATPWGIEKSGNYVYIASEGDIGISIIDVSNPSVPVEIHAILDAQDVSYAVSDVSDLKISGNYLYVTSPGESALSIWDISNPWNPVQTGVIRDDDDLENKLAGAYSVEISGNYAYVSASTESAIAVIDVSDKANPRQVGVLLDSADVGNRLSGVKKGKIKGNYLYVTSFTENAVSIVDISDPTTPIQVAAITDSNRLTGSLAIEVVDNYAYVAAYSTNTIAILDISSSTNPSIASILSDSASSSIRGPAYTQVVGNDLYIAAIQDSSFSIFDLQGVKMQNASIGRLKAQGIDVFGDLRVGNDVDVRGGLSVGSNGLLVGGDIGFFSNTSTAYATNTMRFSHRALFETSVASTSGYGFIFNTANAFPTTNTTFLLSVRNGGTPVFSVSSVGDVHTTGTYYGEAAAVGTPGAPGDLAERVDISVNDNVEPGDVMVVDLDSNDKYRKSTSAQAQNVAGVIATNPTIVLGNGKTDDTAVMTLIGRVPVKVTDENGPIQRGDLLVTASKPGYAMRYDKWQDTNINVVGIVGIALEPLPVNSGKVLVLVKTGWVQNRTQTIAEIQQDLITIAQSEGIIIGTSGQNLSIGEDQNGQLKQAGGNVDLNGYYIVNVAGLFGENGSWEIDDQGRFVTQVQTSAGKKSLYALQSQKTEYVFSGSATLVNGAVRVDFDTITQDIINKDKPIKVSITLTAEANGVFVESKDNTGFYVRELHGGSSNAGFDWVVIAQRKMSGSEEEEEDTLNSVTGTPEIVPVEPKNTTSTEPLIEEEVIPEKIEESTPEEPEISDEQPVATSTPDQIENQIEPPTPPEEDPLDDGSVVPATSTTEDVVIEAPVQEEPLQKEPVVPTSVEEPPVSDDPGVEEGI